MTRDEAIAKLRKIMVAKGYGVCSKFVEASVDGYLALGMLKLDEGTAEGKFLDVMERAFLKRHCLEILKIMEDAGLKVTFK